MEEVTLGLAILLGAGFLFAKLGQLIRLPSVTGYILAGIIMGPSGLKLISHNTITYQLNHFTEIALMLIAFGIGEHIEIKKFKENLRQVGAIAFSEICTVFLLVSSGSFLVIKFTNAGDQIWVTTDILALSLLLGTMAIATAPATVLHVVRELKASGNLTSSLLQIVAVNNGLAIMFFGFALTVAHHLTGQHTGSLLVAMIASFREVGLSLFMGILVGLLIDFINFRLKRRDEMLTVGLALLLLLGEGAHLLDLSPLLAGMAAGFTIVNRDARDVRFFRTLNAFEGPIYVLFFTLAGAHLDLTSLPAVGLLGICYFFCRVVGKISGATLGAFLAKAPVPIKKYLGLGLLPQAGVAIGLLVLVQSDSGLSIFSAVITPVVLGSVVLAEIFGPFWVRFALEKSKESSTTQDSIPEANGAERVANGSFFSNGNLQLIPWTWGKLQPAASPNGVVIFGASNIATVAGLARMATLFAHHHYAIPKGIRVIPPHQTTESSMNEELLEVIKNETKSMGYPVETQDIRSEDIASGIVSAAEAAQTFGIFLGSPLQGTPQEFEKVVEKVTRQASCPVIVVRFAGILHTEKILVPIVSRESLNSVRSLILSLCGVGQHRITLLYLLSSDASISEIELSVKKLRIWARLEGIDSQVDCKAVPTETRVETIVNESSTHDLIIMAASQHRGLKRLFFGSLAESVARHCHKPMLIIHHKLE